MKIAAILRGSRVELDLSNFIPELSEEEVLGVLDDAMPLMNALLEVQLAWANIPDEKREQLFRAHLASGMMTQAAVSLAIKRANMHRDVVHEQASIDDLGFPEFGTGPTIDD